MLYPEAGQTTRTNVPKWLILILRDSGLRFVHHIGWVLQVLLIRTATVLLWGSQKLPTQNSALFQRRLDRQNCHSWMADTYCAKVIGIHFTHHRGYGLQVLTFRKVPVFNWDWQTKLSHHSAMFRRRVDYENCRSLMAESHFPRDAGIHILHHKEWGMEVHIIRTVYIKIGG